MGFQFRLRHTTLQSDETGGLLAASVAGGIADQFVIFREIRGRTNHLPDIEIARLQLKR